MYQRQGDNIITWCEAPPLIGAANGTGASAAGGGVDLALSFQVQCTVNTAAVDQLAKIKNGILTQ